ncbi:tonB-system energizer ExbB [Rhizobium sp. Leaf262]|uniref:tonB-system energizer ExbB n=1 Tax=Rhizobium sp. Leaf262 TaxID=1736312 RepID=UPI000714E594|nr:tonB-system energizer ExbB [Rhizobium sp. Leaf262]KQO77032.1 biopolymer transporter ExbB [Rhizobium sp. Leaf262]
MIAPEKLSLLPSNVTSGKRRISGAVIVSLVACLYAGAGIAQTEPAAPPAGAAPSSQAPAPATAAPPVQPQAPAATAPAPAVPDTSSPQQAAPAPSAAPEASPPQQTPSATDTTPVQPSLADTPAQPSVSAEQRTDIPHNLSPWGMFMAADWVVKGVMIGLAFASLMTWTVWVAKSIELTGARLRARSALKIVRNAKTLSEATTAIENRGGPGALMLRMATHEMQLSDAVVEHTDGGGIKERVSSVLSRIETHAGRRMSRGTGVLATIGSVSPFVGLFGTVWGIMNSFISISESQTTNLAVVAPGIAEALLATAIGLVAAIPAVVIYNVFARSITGYRHLLADVAAGVERLVSRDLDFRRIPPGNTAKPNVSLVGR